MLQSPHYSLKGKTKTQQVLGWFLKQLKHSWNIGSPESGAGTETD